MRFVLLFLVLLTGFPAASQAIHNLSFEPDANRRQPLLLWAHKGGQAIRLSIDTTQAKHGRGSLLIDATRAPEPVGAAIYTTLEPIDSLRGHAATITGWVRTKGFAGKVWLYAHAQTAGHGANLASHDTPPAAELAPAADWQRLQIQLPVGAEAEQLLLGLRFWGQGTVWLDDLQVHYNGRTYRNAPLPGTEPLLLSTTTPLPDWNFERRGPATATPPTQYRWRLDSTLAQNGRSSLQLLPVPGAAAPYAYLGVVPLDTLHGQTLVVRGHVRYSAGRATNKPLVLYHAMLTHDDRSGWPFRERESFSATPVTAGAPAANGWQAFELSVPISHNSFAKQLALGVRLDGGEPIWIDNVQLLINGRPYTPRPPRAAGLPTAAELAWLRQAARPLRTVQPDGGDVRYLAAFGQLVGAAEVIGLGEVTHGSREIFQVKHRLFRYLVEQKGVRALVLEANMGTCLALNRYVLTGEGDVRQLVRSLGVWNTAEVLELVQWMRTHNERASTKIQLLGMDMQHPYDAIAYLRAQVPAKRTDLHALLTRIENQVKELRRSESPLNPFAADSRPGAALQALRSQLAELRGGFEMQSKLRDDTDLPDVAWQRQMLHLIEQYSTFISLKKVFGSAYRDACMAENVHWLRGQLAGAKVAVWAHNAHVAAEGEGAERNLGEWLRRAYGPAYFAVGMAFHEGSFRAEDQSTSTFVRAEATAAPVGTYEYYFHAAKLPLSLLDVRSPALAPGTQWLYQNLLLRDVGIFESKAPFNRHNLRREFDALIFMPRSSPALAAP
ncbi:erythromycin esterase family protein [Hymenobacter latericus]|uniref:erythromycin esterase family protein n=1 Tax=Hymenobacter sp. YIM 151858-1 TaxID=2987688 RepID=UPI002226B31A|nr:erythromycin esterase family protein [Hymenobacter sp. YIM 151858-1]UYZ59649.1 erythromycin esterase family protein [Hymenobacter sp. YIM 151858-1]